MGARTNAEIEAMRAELGAPSYEIGKLWCELQEACFDAIKIAELEKIGIRDGNGYWNGSDVLGAVWHGLEADIKRLREAYDAEWKAKNGKTEPLDLGPHVPF